MTAQQAPIGATDPASIIGARVRPVRVFLRWRQTPGEVVEVDRRFGIARVRFDSGPTRWVAMSILEPAP